MRDRMQSRIDELTKDYEAGQARLAALDREAAHLRELMLRISGARQVLQETLAEDETGEGTAVALAAE